MITRIIVEALKLVGPFTVVLPKFSRTTFNVLIYIDQRMLTDINYSTGYGTITSLGNYSNYCKDFWKKLNLSNSNQLVQS